MHRDFFGCLRRGQICRWRVMAVIFSFQRSKGHWSLEGLDAKFEEPSARRNVWWIARAIWSTQHISWPLQSLQDNAVPGCLGSSTGPTSSTTWAHSTACSDAGKGLDADISGHLWIAKSSNDLTLIRHKQWNGFDDFRMCVHPWQLTNFARFFHFCLDVCTISLRRTRITSYQYSVCYT